MNYCAASNAKYVLIGVEQFHFLTFYFLNFFCGYQMVTRETDFVLDDTNLQPVQIGETDKFIGKIDYVVDKVDQNNK